MEAEASGGDVAAYELPCVFGPQASQEDVYAFVRPVVLSFLGGYHGTVFAYGQTGAGKTHTMQGPRHHPGVIPRALADLFTHLQAAKAKAGGDAGQTAPAFDAVVTMSYLELYNEEIIDLFDPSLEAADPYAGQYPGGDAPPGEAPPVLTIRDNAGPVAVDGLRSVTVASAKEAAAALAAGERRRHVAATALNRASSRSHAVLCVRLDVTVRSPGGGDVTRRSSQLTLVDLAGSERASTRTGGLAHGASGVTSAWLEGTHINLGLLSLGRVVRALAASKGGASATLTGQQHVPWRDSKLTRLLAGALGGNSKACALCCCSPAPSCGADTRNTLRFAERCALVTTRAVLNEHLGLAAQLAQAKLEIGRLRQQLAAAMQAADATQRRRPGSVQSGAVSAEAPVGPAEAQLLASQDEEMARLSAELAHERRARADAEARLADAMQRLGLSGHTMLSTPTTQGLRPLEPDRPLAAASGAVDALFADLRAAQQVLAHVRADVARAATPPASGSGGRGGSSRGMSADFAASEPKPLHMASWASDSPPAKASIRLQDLVPADQFWAATLHDAAPPQPVRGDTWQGGVDGAAPGDMRTARDSLWVSPHWPMQAGTAAQHPW